MFNALCNLANAAKQLPGLSTLESALAPGNLKLCAHSRGTAERGEDFGGWDIIKRARQERLLPFAKLHPLQCCLSSIKDREVPHNPGGTSELSASLDMIDTSAEETDKSP